MTTQPGSSAEDGRWRSRTVPNDTTVNGQNTILINGPFNAVKAIATEIARSGSVNFLGKVTATGGAGNDQLFLGVAEGNEGSEFTKATFRNVGNSISGGTNINYFSTLDSQFEGQLNLPNWI